ncbi:MAG: hypothetical protein ACKO2V_15620, partial [Snowella sp.]
LYNYNLSPPKVTVEILSMLSIPKQYVLDEEQKHLAVQIPIAVYNQIEEILEDFGLAKLMEEVENDEQLSGDIAYSYYQSLKSQNVGN